MDSGTVITPGYPTEKRLAQLAQIQKIKCPACREKALARWRRGKC